MAVDFITKIIRSGVTFNLADPYDIERWGEEEYARAIISAETPGADGEWQGGSTASARTLSLPGLMIGDDNDELRTQFDTLLAALDGEKNGPELTVYKNSDRYIKGRFAFLRREEDEGFHGLRWTLGLRCADPHWYDETLTTVTLAIPGATVITPGGSYPTQPTLTLVVTTIGTIEFVYNLTGESFTITPTSTGTYLVDCTAGTVVKSPSTDSIAIFQGGFLEEGLLPVASSVTLNLTGGAALSSASLAFRKRYHFG